MTSESADSTANQVSEGPSWSVATLRVWGFPVGASLPCVCMPGVGFLAGQSGKNGTFHLGGMFSSWVWDSSPHPYSPTTSALNNELKTMCFSPFLCSGLLFKVLHWLRRGFPLNVAMCFSLWGMHFQFLLFFFFTEIIGTPFLLFPPTHTGSFLRACPWL